MSLTKRNLLIALAALGAGAIGAPAAAQSAALDLSAGHAIGEAYRAAYPHDDLSAARATLIPGSLDAAALTRLRAVAAEDFAAGRVFVYQGWRLSQTEGRLFALLAAA